MAATKQFGRPINVVTTGPSKTITDIRGYDYDPDKELIPDGPSGNKQTRAYLEGLKMEKLMIQTTDRSAFTSFPKGTIVTTVTFTAEDTRVSSGALKTADAVLTLVMTGATVVQSLKIGNDASGKAALYQIVFEQTDKADGTEGTSAATVAS